MITQYFSLNAASIIIRDHSTRQFIYLESWEKSPRALLGTIKSKFTDRPYLKYFLAHFLAIFGWLDNGIKLISSDEFNNIRNDFRKFDLLKTTPSQIKKELELAQEKVLECSDVVQDTRTEHEKIQENNALIRQYVEELVTSGDESPEMAELIAKLLDGYCPNNFWRFAKCS